MNHLARALYQARIDNLASDLAQETDELLRGIFWEGKRDYVANQEEPFPFRSDPDQRPAIQRAHAALKILEARHGQDYIFDLLGVREPRTFFEKVRFAITGEPPMLEGRSRYF